MADMAASVLSLHTRSMPLLAHLEELRKRIIFSVLGVLVGFISCWSFADRIFGLMQQPIIGALRHHGLGGGLVYLNPTEPFNLYLEVALVGGLFIASPFVFYQLWLFIAPGLYRKEKRYVLPFLLSTAGLFIAGGLFGYKMVYPASLDFLIGYGQRFQPMIYDWRIYEAVCNDNRRSRVDFRNANSRVLPGPNASDYRPLDVAESPIFHPRHFRRRGNHHTHGRHTEHVSFCGPHDRPLRPQYRSGMAGEFRPKARRRRSLVCSAALPLCISRRQSRGPTPQYRYTCIRIFH